MFKKVKEANGKRKIYLFGHKIFTYKRKQTKSRYDEIYAKRFEGLSEKEARSILEVQFERCTGKKLDLDNPKSFNEKIQWLKLYYRNPLMTKCADKIGVRDYIREKIGEEYLVPIIGIYKTPDEIDFETLPNQFVMKVNWGSGQNIIVTDKSKLDVKKAKAQLAEWLKPESNHYYDFLEWCYKDIEPKIIIEEFIEELDGSLYDYKFFCCNSEPKFLFVGIDRQTDLKFNFYDIDWNLLPFKQHYEVSSKKINPPQNFDKMKKLAQILSKDFPFVRVDFFEVKGKVYFGELTFYHFNGTEVFEPDEWDYKLGELIALPNMNKK